MTEDNWSWACIDGTTARDLLLADAARAMLRLLGDEVAEGPEAALRKAATGYLASLTVEGAGRPAQGPLRFA